MDEFLSKHAENFVNERHAAAHGRLCQLVEKLTNHTTGHWFPVETVIVVATDRALKNVKAFELLITQDCAHSAIFFVRAQLDNSLRYFGLIDCADPHQTAQSVLYGRAFDKQKDRYGEKMRDAHLIAKVTKKYPQAENIYKKCSSQIHLSKQHFDDVIRNTKRHGLSDGHMAICDHSHLESEDLERLIEQFYFATNVWEDCVNDWIGRHETFGSLSTLKKIYAPGL